MRDASAERELELRDYLDVLWRRKWIAIATTAVLVLVATVTSLSETKVYRSSAEILLQTRTSERIFSPDGQQQAGARSDVETEIQVMKSRSVSDAVADTLGAPASVSIGALGDTSVIQVSAEDVVPERAALIANTYAEVYIEQRRSARIADLLNAATEIQSKINEIDLLLAQLNDAEVDDSERAPLVAQRTAYSSQLSQLQLATELTGSGGAEIVSAAQSSSVPIRPTPRRTALLGGVVGLLLGIGLAFLRDYLDDSLRTKEDIERATALPMLAAIPKVQGWKRGDLPRLVSRSDAISPSSEAYRSLRTSLQFLNVAQSLQLLQVTSAASGDGKTTTVANLAVALADAGQRVLVVDCDLRRPRIHEFFGMRNTIGFTNVLAGQVGIDEAVIPVPGEPNIAILTTGPIPPNPSELLSSGRAASLFTSLRSRADVVIVDGPPVLPVTDGVVLAGLVDATIVVATWGRATRRALHRAVETLRRVGAPLVGAVLNGADQIGTYGHGYGYGQGYSANSSETRGRGRRRGKVAASTR